MIENYGEFQLDEKPPRGPYTGRGPKGYRRPDERIQEDVSERLTEHGDIDASGITVAVSNGEVTLRGTVPDRRTKRLAALVAEDATGVRDVYNELRLAPPPQA